MHRMSFTLCTTVLLQTALSVAMAQNLQQAPASQAAKPRAGSVTSAVAAQAPPQQQTAPSAIAPNAQAPRSTLNWGGVNGNSTTPSGLSVLPVNNKAVAPSRFNRGTVGSTKTPTGISTAAGDVSAFPFDLPNGPTRPTNLDGGKMRYDFPFVQGKDGGMHLLDGCKTTGTNCGAPVAAQFCQAKRAAGDKIVGQVVDFKTGHFTGRDGQTANLSQASCSGNACSGVFYVVCQ